MRQGVTAGTSRPRWGRARNRITACLLASLPALASAALDPATSLDFELAGDDGFVRLSALAPAPTLVNFWRSDCPGCVREVAELAAIAREGRLRVIAVAVQRPSETLAAPESVRQALLPPVLALTAPSNPAGVLARFGDRPQALPYSVVLTAGRRPCAARTGEIDRAWAHLALTSPACRGN